MTSSSIIIAMNILTQFNFKIEFLYLCVCLCSWLTVKNWLIHKKRKVELAPKRTWKKYWVCLKGTMLLFYTCDEGAAITETSVPRHMLGKAAWLRLLSLRNNSLCPSDALQRYRSGSTLAQVMACCLTAPSHYLNQCNLIINVSWHSPEGNFAGNAQDIYPWYQFENHWFKNAAVSPRDQWVKTGSEGLCCHNAQGQQPTGSRLLRSLAERLDVLFTCFGGGVQKCV